MKKYWPEDARHEPSQLELWRYRYETLQQQYQSLEEENWRIRWDFANVLAEVSVGDPNRFQELIEKYPIDVKMLSDRTYEQYLKQQLEKLRNRETVDA